MIIKKIYLAIPKPAWYCDYKKIYLAIPKPAWYYDY